ncbi:2'-5' RNA ligase superfamily-domain-containing protein [Catenaria anguillulae PL171]|uniref:2'-5' RNA ligase superfamily-domain-containing protein n=1 Tax=Catenaria anguillulae PL171 TaxID=765915 RepID=A0A1Y2HHL7_9FUNG|nr:2'-5' RNA ligase superfamily-domain-containing protein [Catenaria anguillulae PL171]
MPVYIAFDHIHRNSIPSHRLFTLFATRPPHTTRPTRSLTLSLTSTSIILEQFYSITTTSSHTIMSRRPTLGPNKSARTAVAIIPPPALWPAIQPLRRAFDPAHPRWPPHINLLFPFAPLSSNNNDASALADHARLPSVLDRIRTALQSCQTTSDLHLQLAQASTFFQRKVAIVHAKPVSDSSLLQIHAALLRAFPQCTDTADHAGGFHPHLTLAKVPWNSNQPSQTQGNLDTVLDAAARAVQEHHGENGVLEWVAQGVYVLERLDNDPFTFVGHVGFDGSTNGDPYGLLGTTYSPDADLMAPLPTPAAAEAVQIAEPKDKCSVVCKPRTTTSLDAIQLAARPWLEYPCVDSPEVLASEKYDQSWVVLPTYQYDSRHQAWAKVPLEKFDQHHHHHHQNNMDSLSIITYNILNSLSPNSTARHKRLLAQLERAIATHSVTVIALQELTPTFLTLLLAQPWVQSSWSVSHTPDFAAPVFPAMGAQGFLVHKSLGAFAHMHMRLTGKKAHVVAYLPQTGAWIANVHLTSNHATNRDPKDKRVAQMDPVGQLLERHARGRGLAVVVGDFNSDDHEEDAMLIGRFGLVDGAGELGRRLDTFDPTRNVLALAAATMKETPHAYDRVVYQGKWTSGWEVKHMDMIGDRVEDEEDLAGVEDEDERLTRGWPASDHYGVLARFVCKATTTTDDEEQGSLISNHEIHSRLAALHNYESQSQRVLRARALDLLTHHLNHLDRMPPLAIPHLLPVGSVRLGLHSPESDTDLLCLVTTSPTLFADAIERTACPTGLRLMRVIRDASVPTAQFMAFDKVHMDVQYVAPSTAFLTRASELLANPDLASSELEWPDEKKSVTSALLSVRDAATAAAHLTPAAQLAFRVLRLWATDNGLYAGRVGYLSGAALVVLVLRVLHVHPGAAHSAAAIVKHFFDDYAQFPFASVAVTVGGAPTAPVRGAMVVESLNRPRVNITRHASAATRGVLVTKLREMRERAAEDPAAAILGLDVKKGDWRCRVIKHGWQKFMSEYDTFIDVGMGRSVADRECVRAWRLAVGTVRWNQVLGRVDRLIEAHEVAAAEATSPSPPSSADDKVESQPPPPRAQEVPSMTVHVWPVAWQTKDVASMSDVAMNKLHDVDVHYLVGVRGVEPGSMLMQRILAEIDAAVRPPALDEVKGAIGSSVAAPWWSYVTCATRAEVAALELVPVEREWTDPGPTEAVDDLKNGGHDEGSIDSPVSAAPTSPPEVDSPPASPTRSATSSTAKQRKSKSKSTRQSASQPASKGKLRPSQDVMHRLLWDPETYDAADFVVGYVDRFLGIKERPLLAFRSDDEADPDWVPLHRIVHFRRVSDGVKVWDREKKVDLVFGSG